MVAPITPFMGPRHDLVVVTAASPGAGNVLSWTVPAKTIIEVVGVNTRLVTNAIVANRHLFVVGVSSAAVINIHSPAGIVQPASSDWAYMFSVGIETFDNSSSDRVYQPLAAKLQIDSLGVVRVYVTNMNGGDQIMSAVIRYYAWQQG